MAQEILIHPQPSESDDYMGTSENWEFCMSVMLVWHSEGVTCLLCSRVSSNVYHTNHSTIPCDNTPEQIKSHKEIIHEITSRVGVSKNIIDRSVQLFILADLTLISIFQSYCEQIEGVLFYTIKYLWFEWFISQVNFMRGVHNYKTLYIFRDFKWVVFLFSNSRKIYRYN